MTDEQIRDVVHLARQKWQEEWTYTLEDIAAILADHSASQDEQSTGICFFCGEPIDGKHESDCPQASDAASSAATVSDAASVLTDDEILSEFEGWGCLSTLRTDLGTLTPDAICLIEGVRAILRKSGG